MICYERFRPIFLDTDIIFEQARRARNDPGIWQWCRQYTDISYAQQEQWIHTLKTDPSIKMFAVKRELGNNDAEGARTPPQLGVCGFTSIDRHNRNAEFSLYIASEYQGKGVGEKALRTLIRHGFFDWGFKRIWGEVFEGNPAIKMFERIGFTKEGELRASYFRRGKFINSTIISILDEEYFDEFRKSDT